MLFWVCAFLAVAGALGMVLSRKAVHSALWIAMTMINLAILYVAQDAVFLGMVQIIVYTGAVMMLFLFVLMVVGVDASDSLVETIKGQRLLAFFVVLGFGSLLVAGVSSGSRELVLNTAPAGLAQANADGNVMALGQLIFGRYVVAFEVTSALLITAALGAMVLAYRDRATPNLTQEMRSRLRFKDLKNAGPLPPPGVYSRHNAVDTPALLPDGSTAENSVPGPLRARGTVGSASEQARVTADVVDEVTGGEGERK